MQKTSAVLLIAVFALACGSTSELLGNPNDAGETGCTKDADCKGDRICTLGTCEAAIATTDGGTPDSGSDYDGGTTDGGSGICTPKNSSLTPSSAPAGSSAFTLTVTGSCFVPATSVLWNGSVRITTYVSPSQVIAAISAQDVASPGEMVVATVNPDPGGGASMGQFFTVTPRGAAATSGQVIAASASHTCVVTSAGRVKCWGENKYGQLGNGTKIASATPVDVLDAFDIVAIAAGLEHTCALTSTGLTACWGRNQFGQLGNGTTVDTPTPSGSSCAVSSALATHLGNHTCTVTSVGALWCWGHNDKGQLGNGNTGDQLSPTRIVSSGAAAVATGYEHSCAIISGQVKCWGWGGTGALGNGSTLDVSVPTSIFGNPGISNSLVLIAGGNHSCATTGNGFQCWGDNLLGQLGNGTNTSSSTPAAPPFDYPPEIATAGLDNTCVIKNGGLLCWGWNIAGALGNGTTTDASLPVAVSGLSTGVVAVSAGGGHTCAVTTLGAVKCWGDNSVGQLGNGTTANSATPVEVTGL